MGSDRFYPEEAPVRQVEVAPFAIQRSPVTNREFAAFVRATNYISEAEQPIDPDLYPDVEPSRLKPGALVFRPLSAPPAEYDWRLWWTYKPGACWRKPEGLGTVFAGRLDHPVVCVSHRDATSFGDWAGLRLPTEAEWEFAARGGLRDADYAWGAEFEPDGKPMANTWTGVFPVGRDKGRAVRTTPVGSYPPNGWGLNDVTGNTWEWTTDKFESDSEECCSAPPTGPSIVVKGGSFLCSPDYCSRYRPSARQPQSPDTATTHIGFRCCR